MHTISQERISWLYTLKAGVAAIHLTDFFNLETHEPYRTYINTTSQTIFYIDSCGYDVLRNIKIETQMDSLLDTYSA